MLELRQTNPRRQGDIGEMAAAEWLTRNGYGVWIPLCHSPDVDLLAQQFVLVADGRKWFIPSLEVGGKSGIRLGGPKYARFEVDKEIDLVGQSV